MRGEQQEGAAVRGFQHRPHGVEHGADVVAAVGFGQVARQVTQRLFRPVEGAGLQQFARLVQAQALADMFEIARHRQRRRGEDPGRATLLAILAQRTGNIQRRALQREAALRQLIPPHRKSGASVGFLSLVRKIRR